VFRGLGRGGETYETCVMCDAAMFRNISSNSL